jgi:hypothetical protein
MMLIGITAPLGHSNHRERCAQDSVGCAAFELGSASSNDCPASYLRLDTAVACEIVAGIANRTYGGEVDSQVLPPGCYWVTFGSTFYFNTNTRPTLAVNVYVQPLCAGEARTPRAAFMHIGWRWCFSKGRAKIPIKPLVLESRVCLFGRAC